jgi:hypothetical protein
MKAVLQYRATPGFRAAIAALENDWNGLQKRLRQIATQRSERVRGTARYIRGLALPTRPARRRTYRTYEIEH